MPVLEGVEVTLADCVCEGVAVALRVDVWLRDWLRLEV